MHQAWGFGTAVNTANEMIITFPGLPAHSPALRSSVALNARAGIATSDSILTLASTLFAAVVGESQRTWSFVDR